jgi:transcriptional regulator with XRE-family HTH domain
MTPKEKEIDMNAKDFLASKGITQQMIADKLGCTRSNVSIWFSGKQAPSVDNVTRITDALNELGANVTYDEVFKVLWTSRQERKGA